VTQELRKLTSDLVAGRADARPGRRVAPPAGARQSSGTLWLLLPAIGVFGALLVAPLINLLDQSFRTYVPGHVGASNDAPYTLQNYTDFAAPAYTLYFLDTFRISLIATAIAVVAGFIVAYQVAREPRLVVRRLWLTFIVAMLFLSQLVRVYAIGIAFGPSGLRRLIIWEGLDPNNSSITEMMVIVGMLNYLIPIAALTLIGTIQNVNPRLAEAAQALGAARWQAQLSITVPLSMRGILSAFLIDYTLCISAFVVPLILGRGQVIFVANLIYSRFADLADYPSGAALSMIMLALSLMMIYLITHLAARRFDV
jgi:ABC-type spermidine/putrescine transport system permease subunit I